MSSKKNEIKEQSNGILQHWPTLILWGCYKNATLNWISLYLRDKGSFKHEMKEIFHHKAVRALFQSWFYKLFRRIRLNFGKRSKIIFFGHFWPYFKQAVFFEAPGAVSKIRLSLNQTSITSLTLLSLSKSMTNYVQSCFKI